LHLPGILGPLVLALVAGCAEFHSSTAAAVTGDAPAEKQAAQELPTSPAGVPAQPLGKLLPPVKELPPIGQLGFSLTDPDEQVQTLPPLLPDEAPGPQPKMLGPVAPDANSKLQVPQTAAPQPTDEQLPQPAEAPPADGLGFPQGDPSRVVPLSLDRVLHWADASKLSAQTLLEASTTYEDLLSARAAFAVAAQMEAKLDGLLKLATAQEKPSTATDAEVAHIQADLDGQQLLMRKSREAAVVASAKLIYLLGLDPASALSTMDRQLIAFTLVNAEAPVEELTAQALKNGPGIHEVENQLHFIQAAYFGDSTGWNLTTSATRRQQQCVTQAELAQAHIAYQDLRAKLTMGVQESREAVLSARDQLTMGLNQLKHATAACERSEYRLTQSPFAKDRSPTEVLLAIRTLREANLAYLAAIRDHNQAQLRLAILTGAIATR